MSDNAVLEAVDTDTVLEAIDIGTLLEGIDLDELADREEFDDIVGEIGAALGREFGAVLGRELGAVIARAIVERLSFEEVVENVKAAIGNAVRELVTDPDVRASLGEDIRAIVEEQTAGELIDSETIGEALGGSEDEGRKEEPDEDESEGDTAPESREDLEELSYRELQSLAKSADVRANLSREEMTDELVETLDLED